MKKLLTVFLIVFLFILTVNLNAQDIFQRASTINTLQYEPGGGGFGGFVTGVDFDNDGLPEIYAVNSNFIDRDGELIPKVYKFEWNEGTATWDSVWGAIPGSPIAQNTWPALTWGDLDKDGKPEIIWSPINYLGEDPNPNPDRILVYEAAGDGSDNLGVDDGFGSFLPNSSFTITDQDNVNLRPIKLMVTDIDADDTEELIFSDRAATSSGWHFGVLSVDDIPDLGGGSETWTVEASGVGDTLLNPSADDTGEKYDFAVVDSTIYLFSGSGLVYSVKYANGTWTSMPPQSIANEDGSFKGTATFDLDNDGTDEIILGGWATASKVYLLKEFADTLQTFEIADLSTMGGSTLNGAASGDLDGDGNIDFVFGTRGSPATDPNNAVFRVEYQGGDVTSAASYTASIIDSFLVPVFDSDSLGGQIDAITIANIDGDPEDEVIYTQSYTRGVDNDTTADVAILDLEHTAVSVELAESGIPQAFYLDQNYPNPFNPATTIKFGLTSEMPVELKLFNAIGEEVMTLISGQLMKAGSYNVNFNASGLASGTYIYKLKAGDNVLSKKMMLLK